MKMRLLYIGLVAVLLTFAGVNWYKNLKLESLVDAQYGMIKFQTELNGVNQKLLQNYEAQMKEMNFLLDSLRDCSTVRAD